MKLFRLVFFAVSLLWMASSPSRAMPTQLGVPSVASNTLEVQQRVCHHYRHSSRSHCTSAQVLRQFYGRSLHFPYQYYGGTPHYAYVQPRSYWYSYPWYGHHRWYRPYRYYSPWY